MFDPAKPETNSALSSEVMRDQLNGLHALIEADSSLTAAAVDGTVTLPAGSSANATVTVIGTTMHFTFEIPEGMMGAQGPAFAQATVDGVTTLNPGDPATVAVSYDGTWVHFTFGIPRGNDGQPGQPGNDGGTGPVGPQGPPFAQAVVDGVNTLNPGENATVTVGFDGTNVRFTFGIPRGATGQDGAPGEVTTANLNSAISSTSSNTNAVSTLGMTVSDPPTQSEVQTIANKLDELILALRR